MIVRPPTVEATRIEVTSEGEQVKLTIGNATVGFHYETALTIAAWLRTRAKEAKARAGDTSRSWRAIGILTDLNGK